MTTKKPKGMDTVFIFEVVWLVACPVMEVKRSSITPHKRPFRVDISEAQPRMLPTMEVLNVDIFFLIVDAGKISTQNWTFSLTTTPRITGRHFSVTVSFKVGPVVGTYVCKIIIEFINYIDFEIASDPLSLIDYQQCKIFTNQSNYFLYFKSHLY